ncbi:trypsin-like peptidase domain-containing protein [Pontibaca salina]|uniref:Trypsin-like peptidase domain-containing protein n=1 Tax=Pontibaca salina TaxID=2795731 RepID=A0A934HLQ5_9RHOB|nr:trypsin-like peptidase domain-containing protein [Pontibaca salina]MBI6630529.1 trypsin-like peptidase domain-containing protein [Pontibaca salina]
MKTMVAFFVIAFSMLSYPAHAQDQRNSAWVQIEARPSLREAQARAQVYAGILADVNGFSLGNGWYAILLGPYMRSDAERVLQVYRAEGQIPSDSFIALSSNLDQQFWPVGANLLNRDTIDPSIPIADTPLPPAQTQASDETAAEARRGEQLLTGDERRDLQTALHEAGFYHSTVDGAFGAGTRRAMSDWQISNGYEATGVLTTAQRTALMEQYNAPLTSVGMERIRDEKAGIQIEIPTAVVGFKSHEAPFAHYESSTDLGARVLLISQPGNPDALSGLYDVMQTLSIVPPEGPRNRTRDRFTIEGRNQEIATYTQATLIDGQIKGFTLVWPTGDEARRQRILARMRSSFRPIPGILQPAVSEEVEQDIDLVSGLLVRKPRVARSGFYVDAQGTVATTADAVESCARISIDGNDAEIAFSDNALRVAVLRPLQPLAPMAVAQFRPNAPRLQSEVTLIGYSYDGVLGAPTLTYGTLADVKGLHGEAELSRLNMATTSGDAGGPVLDAAGQVVGMLLPAAQPGRKLPRDVSLIANATAIRNVLELAGITTRTGSDTATLKPADLHHLARGMTVLVNCWD